MHHSASTLLNPAQQAAAEAGAGPQLILAGAGSGKTRTIIHRIGWLIEQLHVPPHRILAVTFTNKAANELKNRLADLIGDGGGGVVSGTFHSISLRILRQYAEEIDYPSDFQVLDSDDQKTLIKRVIKEADLRPQDMPPAYLQYWIENCKNSGITPELAPDDFYGGRQLRPLYLRYQQSLRALARMDFNDLLLNFVELLSRNGAAAGQIRRRFSHVLVDEYQDTNPVQNLWLRELCRDHRNLTVVGDDDQSIYGWRGADVRNILRFADEWPGAQIHRLEENYRSSGTILALANAIIKPMGERHEKTLRPTREAGSAPRWLICNDEVIEARRVAAFLRVRSNLGVPWREMAILYRANRQAIPLERALRETGIPYRVVGGIGFFERMEIKDAIAYWALLHNLADGVQLLRVCNKPKRGIGGKGEEQLAAAVQASGLRPSAWLNAAGRGEMSGVAARLAPLARLMSEIREKALASSDLGLGELLERSGYMAELQELGPIEAEARVENIQTLQGFIESSIIEGLTPGEFLDRAALLQSGEENRDEEAVSLMSLHRAKGLEFDSVALTGVEEGLLPHQRAIEDGGKSLDEERRLLYVGITRARNRLLLTTSRIRRMYQDIYHPLPSRFLAAVDPNLLQPEKDDDVMGSYARPGDRSAAQRQSGGLTLGANVLHPTFGEGVVMQMEGDGDAARVTVQFRMAGVKRLMVKYAALAVC